MVKIKILRKGLEKRREFKTAPQIDVKYSKVMFHMSSVEIRCLMDVILYSHLRPCLMQCGGHPYSAFSTAGITQIFKKASKKPLKHITFKKKKKSILNIYSMLEFGLFSVDF